MREKRIARKTVAKFLRFFQPLLACFFLVAFCLWLTSCGGVPETFYYTPALEPAQQRDGGQALFPCALGVEKFQSEMVHDDDRLIYRDSPFEIKYYYYRRWVAPPRLLVTEKVMSYLADSGLFEKVTAYPATENVKYVLGGHLLAFEEWDEPNQWYGKVSFKAYLYDPATERVVWSGRFEGSQPVAKKIPAAVVEAISLSLKHCLDDLVKSLEKELTLLRSAQ